MTFDDLILEAREDYLDDSVQPYLWSDKQLLRFTKDAVNEAESRLRSLAEFLQLESAKL